MDNDKPNKTYDLLVIGGGINGVGVAADAAGRGLSVVLCEKDDLANHTSSASSKLIHGGLRYLEQREFKLVREALQERETLLQRAPHLVQPLAFILPHAKHLRAQWKIRLGLWLYDHLSKSEILESSSRIKLTHYHEIKPEFKVGFRYMDCQTDDARLVIANAESAHAHGALIRTRSKIISAKRQSDVWLVTIEEAGQVSTLQTKAIVNAAGAWAVSVLQNILGVTNHGQLRLVKGSHFVLPSLYKGKHAYILQLPDKRIVFAIPYHEKFTLVGTTDIEFNGDPNQVEIDSNEIDYLLNALKFYFSTVPSREKIIWSYSGVRALYDDSESNPAKITREYHLELDSEKNSCPVITVFGGKLTTYRSLAESVLKMLRPYFPKMKTSWTTNSFLPGGDLDGLNLQQFTNKLSQIYPAMPWGLLNRLAKNYGSNAVKILGKVKNPHDLGEFFCGDFSEAELNYLRKYEWAMSVEDILWRRTKLGLIATPNEIEKMSRLLS